MASSPLAALPALLAAALVHANLIAHTGNVYIMWLWPKTATGSEGVGCSVSVCVCLARLIAKINCGKNL